MALKYAEGRDVQVALVRRQGGGRDGAAGVDVGGGGGGGADDSTHRSVEQFAD